MTFGTPAGIQARGWGWRYGTRQAWAVRGIDLDIAPGERVLLLGASGSGKSTLLHALAGVLGGADEGEHAGTLTIGGAHPDAATGSAGLVLQDPDSQAVLQRVGDDVAFGCENLGVPPEHIGPRVRAALDLVGLDVPLDRSTSALSGGQKQRLALAGALAMRPGALLLDEPTANLDPDGVVEVRDAVAHVVAATGATLVVVEHRVSTWLPVVDRVIVLAPGERGTDIVADGSPDAVLIREGASLAAGGIWVPGIPPRVPARPAHAPDNPVLTASALTVGRVRGQVVSGPIELHIRPGEALGITGANGAGKSTLARTLAGLIPPVSGDLTASQTLAAGAGAHPIRWTSKQLLTRIGTVLQSPEHQLLTSTVRDEIAIGPRALGKPADEVDREVSRLLAVLRLERLARANPHTLSGGEKRRLTVGAMLATAPRVCVFDEPTFGQDATTWAELVQLMADLRDGRDADPSAIVAVTHDADVLGALHARTVTVTAAGVT